MARLGDRFVARILTPVEQDEYRASGQPQRLLAKRFAAKEAVAKALGTGIGRGVSWQDITIGHDSHGAPLVILSGGRLEVASRRGGSRVELSLADETGICGRLRGAGPMRSPWQGSAQVGYTLNPTVSLVSAPMRGITEMPQYPTIEACIGNTPAGAIAAPARRDQ